MLSDLCSAWLCRKQYDAEGKGADVGEVDGGAA